MITWEQNEAMVLISCEINQKVIKFRMEESIIQYITNSTPKVFYFSLNYQENQIQEIINFDELKPIFKKQAKLSVTIKTSVPQNQKQSISDGYYSIARGESFMERFLGMQGWQNQEYKFAIKLYDEKVVEQKEIVEPIIEKTADNLTNQNVQKQQTEIKCNSCGSILEQTYDICPICFTKITAEEKDVDIAL